MHVTSSAVSQRIRTLEEHLGSPVFIRSSDGLQLTELGRGLLPDLEIAFASIDRAFRRVSKGRKTLRVSAAPAFSTKKLSPKMRFFDDKDVDVQLLSSVDLVDYGKDHIDIGIRYGSGDYDGLHSQRLTHDALIPLCSPGLMVDWMSKCEADRETVLLNAPRIHDDSLRFDSSFPSWVDYFFHLGVEHDRPNDGARYSSAIDAIQAALCGSGVLLARRSLVEDELANGALVPVLDRPLVVSHGFFVVYREEGLQKPEVASFLRWVLETFRDMSESEDDPTT